METAVAIPLASLILGACALFYQVRAGLSKIERDELASLRHDNDELRRTIRELRDENAFLMRKAAGLQT